MTSGSGVEAGLARLLPSLVKTPRRPSLSARPPQKKRPPLSSGSSDHAGLHRRQQARRGRDGLLGARRQQVRCSRLFRGGEALGVRSLVRLRLLPASPEAPELRGRSLQVGRCPQPRAGDDGRPCQPAVPHRALFRPGQLGRPRHHLEKGSQHTGRIEDLASPAPTMTRAPRACAAPRIASTSPRVHDRLIVVRKLHHYSAVCHLAATLLTRIATCWRSGQLYVVRNTDGTPVDATQARVIIAEHYKIPPEARRQYRRAAPRAKPRGGPRRPCRAPATPCPTDYGSLAPTTPTRLRRVSIHLRWHRRRRRLWPRTGRWQGVRVRELGAGPRPKAALGC